MNTSFAIKQMHLISFSASCTCLPGLGSHAWVAKGIVTAALANARACHPCAGAPGVPNVQQSLNDFVHLAGVLQNGSARRTERVSVRQRRHDAACCGPACAERTRLLRQSSHAPWLLNAQATAMATASGQCRPVLHNDRALASSSSLPAPWAKFCFVSTLWHRSYLGRLAAAGRPAAGSHNRQWKTLE